MPTSSAMMITAFSMLFLLPALISSVNLFRGPDIRLPTERAEIVDKEAAADDDGTRWAVLVAGSNGYGNYRHQADVCHAYKVLRKGGVKEENTIVFMYDDVADNPLEPQARSHYQSPQRPRRLQGSAKGLYRRPSYREEPVCGSPG